MRKTFTLTEILIAIVVIGVVVVITIPVLYNLVIDYTFKIRWKKAYSDLQQAFMLLKSDNNIDVESYFDCKNNYCSKPLFKAIFDKYNQTANIKSSEMLYEWAVPVKYKSIKGVEWGVAPYFHAAKTVNDMTMYYWSYTPGGGSIWVDVNGYANKPNTAGRDLFAVEVRDNKMEPVIYNNYKKCNIGKSNNLVDFQTVAYDENHNTTSNPSGFTAGIGCSAKYIYEQ